MSGGSRRSVPFFHPVQAQSLDEWLARHALRACRPTPAPALFRWAAGGLHVLDVVEIQGLLVPPQRVKLNDLGALEAVMLADLQAVEAVARPVEPSVFVD